MPTINKPEIRRLTTQQVLVKHDGTSKWIDLGDVTSVKQIEESQRAPVENSEKGYRLDTGGILTKTGFKYDVVINEMTPAILEMVHLANAGSTVTQAAVTAPSGTASFTAGYGEAHKLGVQNANTVVVKNSAGTATYQEDVDYTLDAGSGIIRIKRSGAITEGSTILVTYGCAAVTKTVLTKGKKRTFSGSVEILFFDTFADTPVETHKFDGQYYVTDPGTDDVSKIKEVTVRFVANGKVTIETRP